jgi:hypothetical protein
MLLYAVWACFSAPPATPQSRGYKTGPNIHFKNGHSGRIYASLDSAPVHSNPRCHLTVVPRRGTFCRISNDTTHGLGESPQYLCAVSETIADMANQRFQRGDAFPTDHRFDALADSPPPHIEGSTATQTFPVKPPTIRSTGPLQQPLNSVDIFIDDFIHIMQLPGPARLGARRTLFECIDQVLRPLQPSDNCKRKEPNPVKKLERGDATWTSKKVILGWLVHTEQRTIELPPHRKDRLDDVLNSFTEQQRRTSRKKWQQLIGELRSMVLAIPGGRGLFSQLQSVLTYPTTALPSNRLRLTPAVHDQLSDFRWLAKELAS